MKPLILAAAILFSGQPLLAQKAVILVRHAERLDTSTDSVLSAKGFNPGTGSVVRLHLDR
jgi:hypothetical protein